MRTYHHCGQEFVVQVGEHGTFLMIDRLPTNTCPRCNEKHMRTTYTNGRQGFYSEEEWAKVGTNPFYLFVRDLEEF